MRKKEGQRTTSKKIRDCISEIPKGEPFGIQEFMKFGPKSNVYKIFSRLVNKKELKRILPGIFYKPKTNRYVKEIFPSIDSVVRAYAKNKGLKVQVGGAEALNMLNLTTQVPVLPTYEINGRSRVLLVGNLKVKLRHAPTLRLSLAGRPSGIALSALLYLGEKNAGYREVQKIRDCLSSKDFKELENIKLPIWLKSLLRR